MSLQRLGIGNILCIVEELYGVAECTTLTFNFRLVRVHLQRTFLAIKYSNHY